MKARLKFSAVFLLPFLALVSTPSWAQDHLDRACERTQLLQLSRVAENPDATSGYHLIPDARIMIESQPSCVPHASLLPDGKLNLTACTYHPDETRSPASFADAPPMPCNVISTDELVTKILSEHFDETESPQK